MATVIWGWAFTWLAWRLVLEWRIGSQWLPDNGIDEEDRPQGGLKPPADALTAEGERLWRVRWHVTAWGFLGWCAMVGFTAARSLMH